MQFCHARVQSLFAEAFGFVPGSKQELLVAYRPKRKRYLVRGVGLLYA